MDRWLPNAPEPERRKLFFRAVHEEMMRFLDDERPGALQEFLRALTVAWRLI